MKNPFVVKCSEYITPWHMSQHVAEDRAAEMNHPESGCAAKDHKAVPLSEVESELQERGWEDTWNWEDPDAPAIPLGGEAQESSPESPKDNKQIDHDHAI